MNKNELKAWARNQGDPTVAEIARQIEFQGSQPANKLRQLRVMIDDGAEISVAEREHGMITHVIRDGDMITFVELFS